MFWLKIVKDIKYNSTFTEKGKVNIQVRPKFALFCTSANLFLSPYPLEPDLSFLSVYTKITAASISMTF